MRSRGDAALREFVSSLPPCDIGEPRALMLGLGFLSPSRRGGRFELPGFGWGGSATVTGERAPGICSFFVLCTSWVCPSLIFGSLTIAVGGLS